jgi:sulfofructose kinase
VTERGCPSTIGAGSFYHPFPILRIPMPRILCLGMSALDAIYQVPAIPSTPTKVLATEFTECGGGMAANASVAVARLGGEACYWGRVGDDALGTRILGQLIAEGVDVTAVRRIPGCVSPSAAILVDDHGERLVCAYNDPRLDADPSWLPLERISDYHAVLADVRWPAGAAAVFDAAKRYGLPTVFDGDVGPRDALVDLAHRATHVVFSQPGLAHASGRLAPGDGLAEIARSVRGLVGVTLGADGFLWREGARERRIPAPRVVAIDTLAAGDVWHGAFTLGLAEGWDVATAGRFANAAAAIKCSRVGGRLGAPSREDVTKLLSAGF